MIFILLLCVMFSLYAADKDPYTNLESVKAYASSVVGPVKVWHDGTFFYVQKNNNLFKVNPYNLDYLLRKIDTDHLRAFQKCGYIYVHSAGNNEYTLRSYIRSTSTSNEMPQ